MSPKSAISPSESYFLIPFAPKQTRTDLRLYENMGMGLIAGGVSAFITTPLDVMKTRIMLSADLPTAQRRGILATFRQLQSEGMRKMFAGAVPRTMWISLGGAVWFGAFEEYRRLLNRLLN